MNKNWLIRTRHNQILGPVSKAKVIEFVQKGSLVSDDELSMGNGYWFSIKEKDLLDKYLYGDLQQEFNPISEAPNVLTGANEGGNTASFKPRTNPLADLQKDTPVVNDSPNGDEELLPSDSDLEYPDMGDMFENDDVTQVGSLPTLNELNTAEKPVAAKLPSSSPSIKSDAIEDDYIDEEAILPESDDLEYPDMGGPAPVEEADDREFKVEIESSEAEEVTGEIKLEDSTRAQDNVQELDVESDILFNDMDYGDTEIEVPVQKVKRKRKKVSTSKHRNDGILFFLLSIVLFSVLFGVYYYYSKILKKTFSSISIDTAIISSVNAQAIKTDSFIKKKSI